MLRKKMPCQRGDVFASFTQWRQRYLNRIQPKEKILSEAPLCAVLPQISIRCRENPNIHLLRTRRANALMR